MGTTEEFELFKGKSLSSLFEDIYNNSIETKEQLKTMIAEIAKMIDDQASAAALVPIIKEYLDVNIRNDEHLIKLAMIVQRLISAESRGVSEGETFLSDEEKDALIANAESALEAVREETKRVTELKKTVATVPTENVNVLEKD